MKPTAPSFIVFLLSLALALWATLPLVGVSLPKSGLSAFWMLLVAYLLLLAGVVFRRL